jgi:hypothetical protein
MNTINGSHAYTVIRVDGTEEVHMLNPSESLMLREVAAQIGAQYLDSFSLRDGRRVWVDDLGQSKGLPVNVKATALYWSICRVGTTYQIRGDVAVLNEEF